jgi:hypothetical protein
MRDAHIDEVASACLDGRSHGFPASHQVDAAELGRLGGTGMGNADQLYKCRRWLNCVAVRIYVQCISEDRSTAGAEAWLGT